MSNNRASEIQNLLALYAADIDQWIEITYGESTQGLEEVAHLIENHLADAFAE